MNSTAKGAILLLTSALLYSIMPVLIRFLGNGGIPPISQVFLRYIFAFLAALAYFKLTSRSAITIQKRDLLPLAVATVFGYALTNVFFTINVF